MIPDDIMSRTDMTHLAKCVFGYICRKAHGDRLSIGTRLLASVCGTGHQQVARAISEVERADLIHVERGRSGQRPIYRIKKASHIATLPKTKSGTYCDGASHIATEAAHIATRKRQRPIEKRESTLSIPDNLDTADFKAAWKDWIEYRRQLHKPLTAIGTKRLLNRFAKNGPEISVKMILRSVENGWQGIFDLQADRNTKPRLGRVEAPEGKYPDVESGYKR